MSSKSKVYFFFDNVRFNLKDRARIKQAVELIFKKEKKKLDHLSYVFCTDSTLLSINKQYLRHNDYTDIITFDLSETKDSIRAEIYISVDRLRENAKIFKTSFFKELLRVVFHGALHLCGYNDKRIIEKKKMGEKEEFYLRHFK
jgi:probable rRNA maturation factor